MNDDRHTSKLRSVSSVCRMRARSTGHDATSRRILRLISTVQIMEPISPSTISRSTQAKPDSPGRCIFNGSPNDATTISETNPLMINRSICQPLVPRVSRTTCTLNIHEPPPRCRSEEEMKETSADEGRDGRNERKLIVIALICLTHSRY